MSRIRLEIDRLVLNGFDPREAKALADALQGQLSRALSDSSTRRQWARPHRTPAIRLGPLAKEPGIAGARTLGARIGRAVGKGLKP